MMIETRGLCKSFGDHVVLDGIDLDVAKGTIFALLGPNGAGKTTIIQILSTLISADSGEVRVADHDVDRSLMKCARYRRHRPVLGNGQLLTGEENLLLMATSTTWADVKAGNARPHCSTASIWLMRPSRGPPPTPAACGVGLTSR